MYGMMMMITVVMMMVVEITNWQHELCAMIPAHEPWPRYNPLNQVYKH